MGDGGEAPTITDAEDAASTSGPRAAAENAARKEIPMFLALRAVKVA
jgi:hypothetical protein